MESILNSQDGRFRHGQSVVGPGPAAPDGTPVEVILADPVQDEPDIISQAISPASDVLDLGCGVGRIARPLRQAGHRVVCVDESEAMLTHVDEPKFLASIEGLDLGATFDAVLLTGRLVNLVPREVRLEFFKTCERHLDDRGVVIIQCADLEMYEMAPFSRRVEDRYFGVENVTRPANNMIRATLRSEIGTKSWLQNVTLWTFSDSELDFDLAAFGLARAERLDHKGLWHLVRRVS